MSKAHAEIIKETEFSKKYTHVSAISFQKEVRAIIAHYEKYSHSIVPKFTVVADYIAVLLLEDEDDFRRFSSKMVETYS